MRQPDRGMLLDLGKEDATRALVVGDSVYDPLLFSRRLVRFSRRQYLFLHAYRLGVPLAEAAAKAGLTVKKVDWFLARPKTRQWLEDRAMKDHIRQEWQEPGKWWELGDEVLSGKRRLSKDQQVVFMAFGERCCPKPKEIQETSKTTINLNFSAEAVQEALQRQESIETGLVQDLK